MRLKATEIKLNPDNPRIIKDEKFKKLVQSIKDLPEMAEVREVVLNKDHMILGGNMRYKAMLEAGWMEIPVRIVDWSEDKQREFIIKDNISGGEWDWDIIANQYELEDLEAWGVDLPVQLHNQEVVEDEPPEVSTELAISKLGEVYRLGKHKLMCGDCTKDANKLFDKATIGFTSPPYNVGHNLGYKNDNKYNEYKDDNPEYLDLLNNYNGIVLNKCEYSFVNLQFLSGNKRQIIQFLADNIDTFCDIAFWKKSQVAPQMAENVMNSQTECIFIFGGNGSRAINTGNFRGVVSNIVETSSASSENENSKEHNATMPVSLASHFIMNFTQKGDSIYDAFAGTGTTMIAREQLDRTCYMIEIDPKYCDVIRKRYWKFVNEGNEEGWIENTSAIQVNENAISK